MRGVYHAALLGLIQRLISVTKWSLCLAPENARSGTKKALPLVPAIRTNPGVSVRLPILLQGTFPERRPICVDIPSGDIVNVRLAVFAKMTISTGSKTKNPTAQAVAPITSLAAIVRAGIALGKRLKIPNTIE
jgi:hypothetical protein